MITRAVLICLAIALVAAFVIATNTESPGGSDPEPAYRPADPCGVLESSCDPGTRAGDEVPNERYVPDPALPEPADPAYADPATCETRGDGCDPMEPYLDGVCDTPGCTG